MHVLLIEDDTSVADFIVGELDKAGYQCTHRADGDSGYAAALEGDYDIWVIDRMLPGRPGLTLLRELREGGLDTPALVLSALGDVDERVRGLQLGADDYLVKPFSMEELLARLEVLQRRRSASTDTTTRLQVEDLCMDLLQQQVTRGGQEVVLQPREYKLLEYLMRHAGQVVTRGMLLEHVWGYNFDPQTNVIDVHVSRLRQKIDREFGGPLLHTVRGAGYRLGSADA
ncbi:response regulator transcription factor [Mangrovimicrobium sediminis]|uniref:Response regulator transcription factor n=1 Tax=Mangrovimicrobium sediminis TaxID=2562682 RepID=A0A4Z0LXR6_9GAMM|nr:response regulator transcription factor [Haliea sp. SAOS-164]TGD71937.1 response regulator transcription factor [Haliea sp. SAOS-164]